MSNSTLIQVVLEAELSAIVIIGILFFMSLGTWGIIFLKWKQNKIFKKSNQSFNKDFGKVYQFSEVKKVVDNGTESPLKNITSDVIDEVKNFSKFVSYDSIIHRASLLEEAVQRSIEAQRLTEERYLSFVALCSSLAPFLGLLGTVWGIMTSFFEIGKQGSAELSVVAPGIAAALVTTLAGLIVAIPASAAYNYFVSKNNKNEVYYYNFGSHLLSLFKRGDLMALESVGNQE
ncbi:MAG: MotA/TolQ/ExbB proton channel family protein [Fibrobacterales bacterium]